MFGSLPVTMSTAVQGRLRAAWPSSLRARAVTTAAKPRKVTGEELEVALADRSKPLIIDFYADWCGPCVLLAKELEQVSEDLGDKIEILKVDTEVEQDLASQLQIQGLPTLILVGLDPEKPALRTEGLLPANQIKTLIIEEFLQPTISTQGEVVEEPAKETSG